MRLHSPQKNTQLYVTRIQLYFITDFVKTKPVNESMTLKNKNARVSKVALFTVIRTKKFGVSLLGTDREPTS